MRGMENRKWKVESEKLSGLSFRGAKRRGNLGEAVAISPMAFLRSDRLLRDCHVGLRPPRNDKYGGQHRFNGGRYGSGRAFPRLPRARSALAMTNQRTLRHRKNTAHAASLHGAHYPQGARRIRKAAKPPTAAQGTPLQTQLVRAILTIAGSNRQCAAGRKVPLQRKSRGPSGSAKNPGLRFAVPEIFCGFSIRPYRRSRGRP